MTKINYSGAWLRLRAADFLPVEVLNESGRSGGISMRRPDSFEIFVMEYYKPGWFLLEAIDSFILVQKEGIMTRTYRGKFDGEAQDDNAYPAFNAESAEAAVKLANEKWPAKLGENDFTADDLQIFTNNGWVWVKNYNE